ncbi:MAG: hypothetical protein ACAH59_13480 [Pseudobdellovibrionaceae bacterium]
MKAFCFLFIFLPSIFAFAQSRPYRNSSRPVTKPSFTYDLGASTGNYNNRSYTEIQLGLNWFLQEYFIWRNALFTRFGTGSESAAGLDTSARLNYDSPGENGGLGLNVFAGPGYRISKTENTGVFGEAGITLRASGLAVGVGVKSIQYNSPGTDSLGRDLPKTDTSVFLILAAGGAF